MRPQHITAENVGARGAGRGAHRASMRPQHITAENGMMRIARAARMPASMRPQHITAENAHPQLVDLVGDFLLQ